MKVVKAAGCVRGHGGTLEFPYFVSRLFRKSQHSLIYTVLHILLVNMRETCHNTIVVRYFRVRSLLQCFRFKVLTTTIYQQHIGLSR